MVDAVVSFAIKRLGNYLEEQVALLQGVKDEVKSLKKDLEWMHSFIQDAERKQVDNNLIRQWVFDIRDIAHDTEDVLDKFMVQVHDEETSNMLKVDGGTWKTSRGLLTFIKKCRCICDGESSVCRKGKEKVNMYSIGKEIESLQKRLKDIKGRREVFGLENINNIREEEPQPLRKLRQLRRTTSFQDTEINVVGYEDDSQILLAKLLETEPRRLIISIFGPGGQGKTTLARKLYHYSNVMNKFSRRAWVSVSQDYKTHDLLVRIIKSFRIQGQNKLEKMSEEDLERHLHESLQGCSYLVVIDDVWHKEAWKSLKRAFPENNNGSRVIITTRKKDVAEYSDKNIYPHRLRCLEFDESWQLFREKAFENSIVDESKEKLGREMVQKCGGLPLAIVVLGGLLYGKNLEKWRHVHEQIWKDLGEDIEISCLFDLSFNDLPYQMKACFLYLGNFPEDYIIETNEVIRLWVAEGFIPQNGKAIEDVANDYLTELINRSLIEVENEYARRIMECRVHDLLRDQAIRKAKELNFFQVYDEIQNSSTHSSTSCRRLAIYSGGERNLWLQQCNPPFRSLLFFENCQFYLPIVVARFRLLRVLNIKNRHFGKSGHLSEIGNLIHLKYLGLRSKMFPYLPSTICKLLSLQTLDISEDMCFDDQLRTEICKLQELRHLIGWFRGHWNIENLTKLQTLLYIEIESWTKINPRRLVNLREMTIMPGCLEQMQFSFDSMSNLKSLQILRIHLSSHQFFGSLEPLSHCKNLKDLTLGGKIENLPGNLHQLLPNLECLSLWSSRLIDDPMPTLEKLQSLMTLDLKSAFCCSVKMICSAKGFPQLEALRLDASDLVEWQVELCMSYMTTGYNVLSNIYSDVTLFTILFKMRFSIKI